LKKTYDKPTLVRRQTLARIAAEVGNGNGVIVISSGADPN
jgi:hypothetical protein